MTTEWAVVAADEQFTLDARNTGELQFTVSNPGAADDTVVFDVIPGDGSQRAWFDVPEPQRLVHGGGSVNFLVTLTVPAGTAPRRYDMTGLAYSASTAPEESSRSSGRVTYEVKAIAKPPSKWPWIIAAIAFVVIVGGVVTYLLTRPGPVKPAVVSYEAEKLIDKAVLLPAGGPKAEAQKDHDDLKFSDGAQLLFTSTAISSNISMTISIAKEGDYTFQQIRTTDATYANTVWSVDGRAVGTTFLGFTPKPAVTNWLDVGVVHLTSGQHTVILTMVGKTQGTPNYNAGVDAIRFSEILPAEKA